MNNQLKIWGQGVTVYIPSRRVSLGYENYTDKSIEKQTQVKNAGNSFTVFETKCFINFNPKKNVFYKFNYFPDNQSEMVIAVLESTSQIREGCYIRTATEQATSIWGDMIYKVEKIQDVGKYKTLARLYFLSPTSADDLNSSLKTQGV